MARLDVYPMPGRAGRGYLVDIQADLLSSLTTRVVVPLIPEPHIRRVAAALNPVFDIDGQRRVLAPQGMATVPLRELRHPAASLRDHHDAVVRAIDILMSGI